jgi:hypothetical protein
METDSKLISGVVTLNVIPEAANMKSGESD